MFSNIDQLLEALPQAMEIAGVPGLVISLIENRQLVATYPVGVKNRETQAALTADTIFGAASFSKPVFAYGVFKAVAAGLLDLDRPLHHYLPIPDTTPGPA
jgi:CubicO group peptidase (beta-lactamase class C family)